MVLSQRSGATTGQQDEEQVVLAHLPQPRLLRGTLTSYAFATPCPVLTATRYTVASYACAMPCPVLTDTRHTIASYAFAAPCPVLTEAVLPPVPAQRRQFLPGTSAYDRATACPVLIWHTWCYQTDGSITAEQSTMTEFLSASGIFLTNASAMQCLVTDPRVMLPGEFTRYWGEVVRAAHRMDLKGADAAGIILRARYAISGTDRAYPAAREDDADGAPRLHLDHLHPEVDIRHCR